MNKPECVVLNGILAIENSWIREYRRLYGDKRINNRGGEDDSEELFEFEAVKVIEKVNFPRLYKEHDRLRLKWVDANDESKMKSCKTKKNFDKAYEVMMKFIDSEFDGKFIKVGDWI